jgi:hypothetical protein
MQNAYSQRDLQSNLVVLNSTGPSIFVCHDCEIVSDGEIVTTTKLYVIN